MEGTKVTGSDVGLDVHQNDDVIRHDVMPTAGPPSLSCTRYYHVESR